MRNVQHSPGPWKVRNENGCKAIGYKPRPGKQTQYRDILWTVGLCSNEESEAEDLANARLAAAAPDLLSSARAMLPFIREREMEGETEYERAVLALEAAIRKATIKL